MSEVFVLARECRRDTDRYSRVLDVGLSALSHRSKPFDHAVQVVDLIDRIRLLQLEEQPDTAAVIVTP
jgi:hypothetical protein